jgi:hypothetical protein
MRRHFFFAPATTLLDSAADKRPAKRIPLDCNDRRSDL